MRARSWVTKKQTTSKTNKLTLQNSSCSNRAGLTHLSPQSHWILIYYTRVSNFSVFPAHPSRHTHTQFTNLSVARTPPMACTRIHPWQSQSSQFPHVQSIQSSEHAGAANSSAIRETASTWLTRICSVPLVVSANLLCSQLTVLGQTHFLQSAEFSHSAPFGFVERLNGRKLTARQRLQGRQ